MSALRFILKRLLITLPVLIGITLLVFLLLRLVPGDPAQVILGLRATPEAIAAIRDDLGLDRPLHEQYFRWVGGLLQGDLGKDYRSNESVATLLATRLPITLQLTALAMAMALVVALPLGIAAARRAGGALDKTALTLGLVGISIPEFWVGILLILVVSLNLGLLPSSGYVPPGENLARSLASLILPALTLAIGLAAVLVRIVRSSMLEVLNKNYVKFSRAKGLREHLVIYKHALRNAAIPIITVVGLQFGYLLGGAVIVEQVFALPGLGSLVVNATLERNYPVVQAGVLVTALLFLLVNVFTDVLYAYLNPRISAR